MLLGADGMQGRIFASALPFPCQIYCNGHQYLMRQLDKREVSFHVEGNSFLCTVKAGKTFMKMY
jgi:hypothetical protein